MSISKSKSKRRMSIILNYGFLLTSLIFAFIGEYYEWSLYVLVCFWGSVAFCLLTFGSIHFKTGLWRLVHAKVETLDEREMQLTLGSLRYSYTIFTILALLVILCTVIFGVGSQTLRLIIFWVLLYLAHTLPSSIIGWTEYRMPIHKKEDKCLQP
jgi:hypothetical protein